MTKEELAAMLNGREYRKEITREEEKQAREAGLVVLFGASDDLAEFRGCLSDEVGCNDGATLLLLPSLDLLPTDHECDCDFCDFENMKEKAHKIEAIWDRDNISWQYETEIPHATFDVMEDGEVYCRGIVFDSGDLSPMADDMVTVPAAAIAPVSDEPNQDWD